MRPDPGHGLFALADALEAIDGREYHVTVYRNDWGSTQHIGPNAPGMDLDALTEAISRRLALRSAAQEMS